MADYKVRLGATLDTKELNKQVQDYDGKINVGVNPQSITSDIDTAIQKYKPHKTIEVQSDLNLDGINKKIENYSTKASRKKIKVALEPDFQGIEGQISNHTVKTPLKVGVDLNWAGIAKQISQPSVTLPKLNVNVDIALNDDAIGNAIDRFQNSGKARTFPLKVKPDLSEFKLPTAEIEKVLGSYEPRTKLNVGVRLLKGSINSQIAEINTQALSDNSRNAVILRARLTDNAVADAISAYKTSNANKLKIPIDLTFNSKTDFDAELKAKIDGYQKNDVEIPVKLSPAKKGFKDAITKKAFPIKVELASNDVQAIRNQLASIQPEKPITVKALLDDSAIDTAINEYQAKSPTIKVNIKANDGNVDSETGKKIEQSPITVNVKLDREKLNEQIRTFKTQTKLKVGVKLDFASHEGGQTGIAQQINNYKTKSKIKVGVQLDKDDIAQHIATIKTDTPIKLGVELDPEGIKNIRGQVNNLKKQIEALGNVRINLGGSGIGSAAGSGGSAGSSTVGVKVVHDLKEADIQIKTTKEQAQALENALGEIGFEKSAISAITNEFDKLDVTVERITTRLRKDGVMTLTIKGLDEAKRAVTSVWGVEGKNKPELLSTKVTQKLGESERFIKQQKRAVADLTNQINQVNRAAIDPNAHRPIKDTAHLDNLKSKYTEIILAIEAMGNASSNTFEDERNKVKALIGEYKSLKSEYKNAENISLDFDGDDFGSGFEKAKNKLAAFKREAKEFPQMTQTVKELDTAFENVGDAASLRTFTNQLEVADSALKNIKAEANEANSILTKAFQKIESLSTQVARLNPEANPRQLAELSAQLEEAEADYMSLKKAFGSKLSLSQQGNLQADADDLTKKLRVIEEKHRDTRIELARKISIHLEAGKFTTQVERVNSGVNGLSNASQELKVKLEALKNAKQVMDTAFASSSIDEQITSYRQYLRVLEDVENQLKQNQIHERDAVNRQKLEFSKQGLSSDMTSWLRENSVAAKRFGDDIKRLQVQLETCDNSVDFNNIKSEFRNVQKEAKALGLTGLTTFDKLKYKFKEYMAYFSVAEVFMYAEQGLRSMFEQVKLIDSAMTELKKVTDETDASYNKFLKNAASRSKEIGTTIDGLVSSTADFARLGYGFEDAQGLAEVANIYAVVGDEIEGVEGATKSLISTMAAFQDEMNGMSKTDFAMSIIDKFNEIGNNFAISSGGIGEALERSASSLMAANNTIDESIALITAANTVVQNPDAVGTAFKTISMRIRGAKTELEEAGLETEGMVDSTAKLRSEILALSGVDIMENANEFKSTYKIMDELAQKWEDLSDIQQATITELIAGKRQGNIVSSLMTNFDTAREALDTSMNSAGSAMREHEKWQQSLEAQINKLKASWQGLSQAFLKSDFLHGALDAVIGLVDGLTKLIDKVGVLPTLFTGFAIFKSFGNKGLFKTLNNDLDGFINKVGIANKSLADLVNAFNSGKTGKGIKGFISGLSAMKNSLSSTLTKSDLSNIEAYNSLLDQGVGAQTAWYRTMQSSSDAAKDLVTSANGGKVALDGMKAASVGAKAATIGLQIATTALNAALTMGISFLVSWAVEGIMKLINAKKELAEQVEEVTSKFKEQHEELQKLKGDYDTNNESSMISRYEKLSKGVDNLGRNVSLTADEYSEYQSIVNKIAEQIPSLVSGYDSQGNALLSCKGNVEELTKAYEDLIAAENRSVLNNAGNIGEDFANKVKDFEETDFWTGTRMTTSDIGHLKKLLQGDYSEKEIRNLLSTSDGYLNPVAIQKALEDAGIALEGSAWEGGIPRISKTLSKLLETDPEAIKRIIESFESDLNEATAEMKTIAQAALSDAFDLSGSDYYDMSDSVKGVVEGIVDSWDYEFYKQYKDDPQGIKTYINGILDQFQSLGKEDASTFEAAFNLKTQFNDGEVTYGEYADGIQAAKDIIDNLDLDDEVKSTIKLSLDDSEIQTQYNHIYEYLRDFYTNKDTRQMDRDEAYDYKFKARENDKKVEEFLNSLTADELAAVIDLKAEIDWENTSAEDIRKQIEDQVKLNEALSFDASIEVDKTALEAFNTALAESASAMGLSEESIDSLKAKYSDLEGYNPHTLFEKTANGVKVNREELAKLEKKYNDLTKTEVQEHLDTLVEEYNKCTKAIDSNIGSQEKLELISKREKYAQQIEELAEYQAQLEGVTGAYQRWIDAQNTPEDYEGYQAVATSREDIEDEISRGFLSNSTKEYIDLLSGKDLVGGSIDDYYNAWKKLDETVGSTSYSIHDFFTVNDDGDITSTGIDRFFKGLQQDFKGSVAKFNEESGKWEYDFSQENLQKIQDEWGLGIEAIELLLEAAAAAGYDIDWGGIFDDLDIDKSNFESVEAMISLAEKAQEEFNKLKGVEDVEFNFRTNTIEEATTEVEKARKAYLDLITNKDGSINLKAEGAEQMQFMLSTLITQKQLLSTPAIMKVDTSQIDKAKTDVIEVINKAKELQTAYENYEIAITTGVDVEGAKKDLNSAIDGMKGTSVDVRADLKLPTNEELEAAKGSIGDIKVGAKLDGTAISDMATKIQTECTPEVIAKVTGLDESAIDGGSQQVVYTAEHSDVDNFIDSLSDISKKIIYTYTTEGTKPNPSNIERSITYKYKTEGDVPEVNGTANANGTAQSGRAFTRGNWGIKGSGTALVGELGMETLVRGGHFYTIGDNGAEFIKYKQGDIIFNHKQTEELFKNGKVTSDGGRGRMFANGSAYAEGTALWQATASGSNFASNRISRVLKDSGSGSSSSKSTKKETEKKDDVSVNTTVTKNDASTSVNTNVNYSANATESDFAQQNQNKDDKNKDKFEETFDWITIAIERIEREIDNLDQTVGNVYKSWGDRNTALSKEITKVGEEITLQENAATKYLEKANSIEGLSADYITKIQNGTLNLEDFAGESDEKLVAKIKEYQQWYELYLDCIDAAEKLKQTEAELYAQRFENVVSEYDGILQGFEHTETMLNEYISQAEAKGHIVSKNYYEALKTNKQSEINKLIEEQSALLTKRNEAEANGIDKNSEDWYNMCAEIDGVTQAIEAGKTALIEYDNAMRDIDWQVFDLIQEQISDVIAEADFLIDLMSNDKLFDDNGKLTDKGIATMGLHGQNYNTYMYQADDYAKEIASLDTQIAQDPYDQELINRRRELIESQREAILNAEQEKQAIKDLVEEGVNLELDALQELIDKHNEELDSMKDLYDYQKKVKEQTEEIASLEKQIAAYANDDSEEAKAKIQELRVSLEEANENLQETEYDKYIADQSALLDALYLEYENVLNARLDDVDALLAQVIDAINIASGAEGTIATALGSEGAIAKALGSNATTIKSTLETEAKNVGTTLSTAMKGIWSVDEGNAKSVITEYGKGFQNKQTTTNTVLGDIKTYIGRMVDDVDKDATTKVNSNKTQTSAKKNPVSTNGTAIGTAVNAAKNAAKSTGDGKPKIGDKVKFLSGKYYYDSQGTTPAGDKNHGKEVYITNVNTRSWATHPYHISTGKKLGKGDLGWLKLSQISGYATGKKNFLDNEIAWTQENGQEFIIRPSDGAILTPIAKGDSVLTSAASSNIWDMANSPAEFIKDNLNLGANNVPNNSNTQSNYTQHLDKVVFNLPNVKNYEELLSAMQKDKNFERLILSMTIDQIAGKSGLAKNKSIR